MDKALTNGEMLRAACAHILNGIDQHQLAFVYNVNQGRINEAVKAIEWTLNNRKLAYKLACGKAHVTNGDTDG